MHSVVVTGMGFVTCLGHSADAVSQRLQSLQHGFATIPAFVDDPNIPISVAAPVPEFDTASSDPEDWVFPDAIRFRLEQLRALSPNALYAHFALRRAVEDANLQLDAISDPRTGLFTASSGSALMMYHHMHRMKRLGPSRCSPLGIVASIAGTLNFNLAAAYHIRGASSGFVSACASSGHALGYAFDEIASGRQDRMLVIGAEDFTAETIVPFAAMRVLSLNPDPDSASRPFDSQRDGFVATGGAVCIILENAALAAQRNAAVKARFNGWGQATDGHHIAIAHPGGDGLQRAMRNALDATHIDPDAVDYINAHATSTPAGDRSECAAIRTLFGHRSAPPAVSSTKALTGHALSLSSIMEAAFCVLAIDRGFTPGSAHITDIDPAAAALYIPRQSLPTAPAIALSNSSGFGGANVALLFSRPG